MKIRLNQLLKASLMLIFAGLTVSGYAQNGIKGIVTDAKDGSPLSGVTVTVKGTAKAVKTDANGAYSIDAAANSTLVFTSVTFSTEQVKLGAGNVANVKMTSSTQQLSDVVVVAYGTKRKGDLTGSAISVGTKDFQRGVINSSEQLLQGKVAGLEVTTGGGSAGGGSKIRIRGGASLAASNEPLIVVDGVPVEGNTVNGSPNYLGTINTNDIESITVLKDAASTVLYGSRASNGVLLVTTKKGTSGKTVFNFNSKFSVAQIQKYNSVLTGDQIRQIVTDEAARTKDNTYKSKLGTANTDWQKAIFQDANGYDNNLSASGTAKLDGGAIKIPFRASLGYLDQDGILRTNNSKRVTASLNLSPKFFTDHLSVNLAVKNSSQTTRFADEGAIGAATRMDPTQPIYSGQTKYGGYYETLQTGGLPEDLATRNPVGLLTQKNKRGNVNRTVGNVQLDYKLHFLPDLHLQLNVGLDNSYGTINEVQDSSAAFAYKSKGFGNSYSEAKKNYLTDVSLFYTKDIPSIKSKVDVLALHSYQTFKTTQYISANTDAQGVKDPTSNPERPIKVFENRIESYVGRVNYSFNDKYLLSASIRRDATSKFSPDYRVGYFPGVSVAWKLKNDFFKNSKFVNELKIRASYGKTGNQDGIGGYAYQPTYSASTNSAAQYQFGNNYYSFLRPDAYIVDRTWESTATKNIGLDFGFLSNRISGSVDVYEKLTSNLIANLPIAPGANFTNNFDINAGNQTNKGIEANLNLIPVKTTNFTWSLNLNGSYNTSEITNLFLNQVPGSTGLPTGSINGATGNTILRYVVGSPAPSFYPAQQVYDAAGKPIEGLYADNNRDGSYSDDDRFVFKKSNADFLFGLSTQFNIYKFSVGLAAHGQVGNYNYNNFNSANGTLVSIQNSIGSGYIGNVSTNYLETRFQKPQYLSSYYIENGSFFRLDNINLGYDFGRIFKSKTTLNVNAIMQNVFVATKYTGLDPELTDGVDKNIYPRPRIISVGASINF